VAAWPDILTMNILFIGDIVGKIGRKTIAKVLPSLKKDKQIDLVIANAENSAHGAGVTEPIIKELESFGIDYFTSGDHAFDNKKYLDIFENLRILRPANYAQDIPGQGYAVIPVKKQNILLINLIGQVFMNQNFENPFHKLNEILANKSLHVDKLSAIIIDIHAEATSEKISFKHFANGRVSAIIGSHTHIMTADPEVTSEGTAYITDAGMVGAADECLGVKKDDIIKTFLTQIKLPHIIPEKGRSVFNAVLININSHTRQATAIKPITEFINIK